MKQHITKEQWNELNDKEKGIFLDELNIILKGQSVGFTGSLRLLNSSFWTPTIGQMIEFLGYDLRTNYSDDACDFNHFEISWDDELDSLCDDLFELVKQKLVPNWRDKNHWKNRKLNNKII